jgi:2-haloacid dehalogenase
MTRSRVNARDIDAIVFDVIGTLVDEHSAWANAAQRLGAATGVENTVELHAAWAEHLERRLSAVVDGEALCRPHRELVSDSARDAIAQAGGRPSTAALALVEALDDEYVAWPDVAPATAQLRRDRLVAGVSNGDLDSLARLSNNNAISWDIALSTGSARTFKPAPAAYRYAIDALRINPVRTLFVAAHPWDLRHGSKHGFRTAYIARPGAERPSESDQFDFSVDDVSALATLLE